VNDLEDIHLEQKFVARESSFLKEMNRVSKFFLITRQQVKVSKEGGEAYIIDQMLPVVNRLVGRNNQLHESFGVQTANHERLANDARQGEIIVSGSHGHV